MTTLPAPLLSAAATVLMVLFYFFTAVRVGILRGRFGIRAPLCIGHPQFDRAYRVQLNTLEQMGIMLPVLWVAGFYPIAWSWLAPLIGVIWVAGRIAYSRAYMRDPDTRLAAAGFGGLCNLALFIIAVCGVARAWMAQPAPAA
jgi:glutathione S-transferase